MLAFCISAHEEYQSRAHQAGMLWNIKVTFLQLLNTQTLICHNVTMLAFHISALGSINPEHIKKGSYGPMVSQLCMLDTKLSQTLSCRIVTMLAFCISSHEEYQSRALK